MKKREANYCQSQKRIKWKKGGKKKCVKLEIIGMLRKCGAGADKYV